MPPTPPTPPPPSRRHRARAGQSTDALSQKVCLVPLPAASCLLPTASCLLPTASCQSPIASCPLTADHIYKAMWVIACIHARCLSAHSVSTRCPSVSPRCSDSNLLGSVTAQDLCACTFYVCLCGVFIRDFIRGLSRLACVRVGAARQSVAPQPDTARVVCARRSAGAAG